MSVWMLFRSRVAWSKPSQRPESETVWRTLKFMEPDSRPHSSKSATRKCWWLQAIFDQTAAFAAGDLPLLLFRIGHRRAANKLRLNSFERLQTFRKHRENAKFIHNSAAVSSVSLRASNLKVSSKNVNYVTRRHNVCHRQRILPHKCLFITDKPEESF